MSVVKIVQQISLGDEGQTVDVRLARAGRADENLQRKAQMQMYLCLSLGKVLSRLKSRNRSH